MKVALVGFQGSGKTSVFNALTGQRAETGLGKKNANLGRIQVPDTRVDKLSEIYKPKKTTYAEIQFVDAVGPGEAEKSDEKGLDAALVGQIREADALVHVVRAFANPQLSSGADPVRDLGAFEDELILTDLVQIEARISRLKKQPRTKESDLLEKLQASLENGTPLRRIEMSEEDKQFLTGFRFLSQKPMLVVLNVAEDALVEGLTPAVAEAAKARHVEAIPMCATIEAEIMAMEPADQAAFLADLGLKEPVRARFIQAAYRLLDLISFLTSGEDEVRAWTIRRGLGARLAAGKIHSDIERGFIRAEVTPFTDLIACGGSEAKCKEQGKTRLEGKDYIVQDGDIVHFRHSS